jgi:1,4-dihydroxy-2-naphthoate octaprenyltransferase
MRRKLKGYFMLFRILPVLVWTGTASLVAGALVVTTGHPVDWRLFGFVVAVAALIQGYPTHIVNEIYDWRSGADPRTLGERKSGGSKVLQAGLLKPRDLWMVFTLSSALLFVSVFVVAAHTDWRLFWFFAIGYVSGISYTLPPFRWAYRPFLGEWLGGFTGVVALVLGLYFAETRVLRAEVIWTATALGLQYISIMMFFHYLDYESDRLAVPRKLTTVVFLGIEGSRWYAIASSVLATGIFVALAMFSGRTYAILGIGSGLIALIHYRCNPTDARSIVRNGRIITFGMWLVGLTFATLADPRFAVAALVFLVGLWAHKKFGKIRPLRSPLPEPASIG